MIRTHTANRISSRATGFWDDNLGYAHSFISVLMALTLGLAFHIWVGYSWRSVWPATTLGTVALSPLLALAVAARVWPGSRLVRWITGIPFAMTSTGFVGLLALAGGIVPQSVWAGRFGMESLWGSWPFLMVSYLMVANLVGSCGRRCWPLTYTNVVYLASHLGLTVALLGGAMSSLMLERRTMVLFQGIPNTTTYDSGEREHDAPFEITLKQFRMDSFAPTFTLAVLNEKAKDGMDQHAGTKLAASGTTEVIAGYRVRVIQHLSRAAFDGHRWRAVAWEGAAPASHVEIVSPNGKMTQGWVSAGSMMTMPAYLQVAEDRALLMNPPRPKRFESTIEIGGQRLDVGVNKPAHYQGFDIYQFSYDEKAGAASSYSVIELVRDGGLPIVYTGIFMMLFGAGLHLWNGIGGKK